VPYNLIDERWIPVERQSGKVEMIAPAQVAEREDPPQRIASPRPDFDGALLEFLIGLLQTAALPPTEREWEKEFESPPAVTALLRRFDKVRNAFFLDGDGPRFMQDLTVGKDPKAGIEPIGALLIDRVGEAGLEEAPALFAKPGRFAAMGNPAVAAALMALQSYAPAGGRGQLTSLRGGGPLTTLVTAQGLWQTAWLNVLPKHEVERRLPGDPDNVEEARIFPWMARTRTSGSRGGKATPPQVVHPLQHFWGLPRRVRLVIEDGQRGDCSVAGTSGVPIVRAYVSRPDGTSYDGDYRHPWTPYTFVKSGDPWNPMKGSSDGLPYRDWPLLVTGNEKQRPATVVAYFASTRRRELVGRPGLRAHGYAMDKMKPLQWCCSDTPLITVIPGCAEQFASEVEALVAASEDVRKTTSYQVKSAWSDRPRDLDVFGRLNPAFWSATERAFFTAVRVVKEGLETDKPVRRDAAKEAWLAALQGGALDLFDALVEASPSLAAPDLRRAVVARRDLGRFTSPSSPKLRRLLGLAEAEIDEQPRKTKVPKEARELDKAQVKKWRKG
jgi:CRISPR system Cascade subunit CasA